MSRGFSLIELMISLALFGLIAGGAMQLVVSGTRSQSRSARIDNAQSGVRAGLDFITREVLSASAGASSSNVTMGTTGAAVAVIQVTNNSGSLGPDKLDIYSIDASYLATIKADVTSATTAISVDSIGSFAINDWVLVTNYASGTLMKLSAVSGTALTVPGPNTFPTGVTSYEAVKSWVFKSRHTTFAVDAAKFGSATTSAVGSVLTLDLNDGNGPQPLAEGVEDFQVALAIDTNGDGQIATETGTTTDEWIYNNSADTLPASLANLKAVRITIVGRTTTAEKGSFPARPTIEDHAGGSSDGYLRRLVRSEIAVRNLNL